eukprot:6789795-Pyramimonas_sp.AAC.1
MLERMGALKMIPEAVLATLARARRNPAAASPATPALNQYREAAAAEASVPQTCPEAAAKVREFVRRSVNSMFRAGGEFNAQGGEFNVQGGEFNVQGGEFNVQGGEFKPAPRPLHRFTASLLQCEPFKFTARVLLVRAAVRTLGSETLWQMTADMFK